MVARSEEQLAIDVIVRDALTAEMRRMGLSVEKFEKSTNRPLAKTGDRFDTLSTKALGAAKSFGIAAAAAATLGAAYSAVRGASQYGKAIAEVSTLVDTQRVNIGQLSDEILKLAAAQNQSELVVAKGVYQALSAGVSDANEALKLTNEAAKLAVAGVSDTASAVDLLTTVVNAYGLEAAEAARISDVLFKTVQLGKTTIPELSASLGQVVPLAASLGVSIEEVAAAVATLTLQGVGTSEAVTQVRATLTALLKGGDSLEEAFARIGKTFNVSDIASRGLVNTLLDLREATGGSESELVALLGRVEAVNATLGLTQGAGAKATSTLRELEDSAGATGEAFDKQMSAPVNVLTTVFNKARIAAVEFGGRVIEMLARIVQRFQGSENLVASFRKFLLILGGAAEGSLAIFEAGMYALIETFDKVAFAMNAVDEALAAFLLITSDLFGQTDASPFLRELDRVQGKVEDIDFSRVFSDAFRNAPEDYRQVAREGAKAFSDEFAGAFAEIARLGESRAFDPSKVFLSEDAAEAYGKGVAQSFYVGVIAGAGERSGRLFRETTQGLSVLDRIFGTDADNFARAQAKLDRSISGPLQDQLDKARQVAPEFAAILQSVAESLTAGDFARAVQEGDKLAEVFKKFPELKELDLIPKDAVDLIDFIIQRVGALRVEINETLVDITGVARSESLALKAGNDALSVREVAGTKLVTIGESLEQQGLSQAEMAQAYLGYLQAQENARRRQLAVSRQEQEAVKDSLAAQRRVNALVSGTRRETATSLQLELRDHERLILLREEEARAAARVGDIEQYQLEQTLAQLREARELFREYIADRESEASRELDLRIRLRVLDGEDSLEAELERLYATAQKEQAQFEQLARDAGRKLTDEQRTALRERLRADAAALRMRYEQTEADKASAEARKREEESAKRVADEAERALKARRDEQLAYSESQRLQAAIAGGIDGRLQLQQLATKERINNLRELADQGVLTAEAFRELFGIVVELGQQDRLRLIDETTLSQAQLAADAVALVTNRLEDRLDAIRAADAFERNRAQEVAKDYTDEAAALESLNAQIDAQTAALVQQEVIRDRERSGEEIQRWERVREAIARVNAEVAAGNVTLSERQMFLIETIRQMEVEANTLRQGFQAGFEDFSQYAGNLAAQGQRAASDVAYGFSNNLGTAIFDIGRDFKNAGDAAEEFGRRTLESIAQIAAQLAALQIVKSGLGFLGLGVPGAAAGGTAAAAASPPAALFATGGVARGGLGDLNPVYGYADGGPIVRKPHTAVIGEGKYDEAIVPLPDGRSIPVEMRSGGRQGEAPISVTQTFNFTVQADRRPGDRGQLTLDPKTIRQIQDAVASGMAGGNQNLRAAVRGVK